MRIVAPLTLVIAIGFTLVASRGEPDPSADKEAPVVSNVVVDVDPSTRSVSVRYDLADAEGDSSEVALSASTDGGETFLFPVESVAGDVGFPVGPGTARTATWTLDQALFDLAAQGSVILRVTADDRFEVPVEDVAALVDSDRMLAELQSFERIRHYDAGFDAIQETKDYIQSQFEAAGVQASRQPFAYEGWSAENVIGRHPGDTDEAEVYIVDAHFDTVPTSPGVDDNASGVVGVLEAMRVLSQFRFEKSIKFIGFDLEEVGLRGSEAYVDRGIPPYEQTQGVFNFEMIGYTCLEANCDAFAGVGNYINSVYSRDAAALRWAFENGAGAVARQLQVISTPNDPNNPNFRRSDHAHFWDAGIPALFINDGANFRNPHYHQDSDRVETINLAFMTNIVKATVAALVDLAEIRHSGSADSRPFDVSQPTSRSEDEVVPTGYGLSQNHPNPFAASTSIEYKLREPGHVSMKVYNLLGQAVYTMVDAQRGSGPHVVDWNAKDYTGRRVAPGLYLYRLRVGDYAFTRRMVVGE